MNESTKKEKKITVLLNGHFGENNAGDGLLLVYLIKGILKSTKIEKIIILAANITNVQKEIHRENIDFKRIEYIYSGRWGLFERSKRFPRNLSWIIKTIISIKYCDYIITGPGSIIKDSTNAFFIPFFMSKIVIAKIFRIK